MSVKERQLKVPMRLYFWLRVHSLALLSVWWIRHSLLFKVGHAKHLHMGPILELWGAATFWYPPNSE